jgi:hypothetical protein
MIKKYNFWSVCRVNVVVPRPVIARWWTEEDVVEPNMLRPKNASR